MPSLTVRQIDDRLKKRLRLRAARQGRWSRRKSAPSCAPRRPRTMRSRRRLPTTMRTVPAARRRNGRSCLIIGGGIAAYKSLDLIRRLRERALNVRVVMTRAAQQFVTPLAAGALAGERAFTDLFDPQSEFDVGHIRLARDSELVVVAPATADLIARMANGIADDLATAVLLATRARILIAPAMNPAMWAHRATRRNLATLAADGVQLVGPGTGEMAESHEAGVGRMAEPIEIAEAALAALVPVAALAPSSGCTGGTGATGGIGTVAGGLVGQARAGDIGADA